MSEELRARIKRSAHDMGCKSPTAPRRGDDSYSIGVLIPERYLDSGETFYRKLYQEVTARAKRKECFTLLELYTTRTRRLTDFPSLLPRTRRMVC